MVQFRIDAAQGVGKAVHAAQSFLEGQRTLHGRAHHVHPRFAITGFGGRAFDVFPGAPQAVEGDAVCGRVEGRGHERFDAMRDSVHAGGGGEHGRQTEGQLRIADGHARHDIGGDNADLATIVEDQDGAATHLATGARRGRNCNQRRGGRGDAIQSAFNHREALQRTVVGGADRDALGQIDR
ncbi:hypothetical protein D3C84_578660 [compost metagenome]